MLGEAQGEREDGSARGLPAPLAAANKGKKCPGQGPPEPQRCPPPCPLPNFAAWIHSVQAAWTEVAALQPCQTGASSLILMGILSRRAPLAPPKSSHTPKVQELFLPLSGVTEQLKPACATPEPWR